MSRSLYSQYVAALARSRTDDLEAKKCANLLLGGAPGNKLLAGPEGLIVVVSARLYLARVLRRLGEDDEAKSQYVVACTVAWIQCSSARTANSG